MRLLNISTLELKEFGESNLPPYAIASHRWTTDETTYKDVRKRRNLQSKGYQKIQGFCSFMKESNVETTRSASVLGIERNCQWLWIDTACIDQKSSAEITESINSMLHYYASSEVCYAYLQDVGPLENHESAMLDFMQSEWFRRGWTLQELLAPRTVVFLSRNWETIGHKCRLRECDMSCRGFGSCLNSRISQITSILKDFLSYSWITDRSSDVHVSLDLVRLWVKGRATERVEDKAYCLLGLLGVNLVPIYGERENAWTRLEEEYLKKQDRRKLSPSPEVLPTIGRFQSAPVQDNSARVTIYSRQFYHMSEGPPESLNSARLPELGHISSAARATPFPRPSPAPQRLSPVPEASNIESLTRSEIKDELPPLEHFSSPLTWAPEVRQPAVGSHAPLEPQVSSRLSDFQKMTQKQMDRMINPPMVNEVDRMINIEHVADSYFRHYPHPPPPPQQVLFNNPFSLPEDYVKDRPLSNGFTRIPGDWASSASSATFGRSDVVNISIGPATPPAPYQYGSTKFPAVPITPAHPVPRQKATHIREVYNRCL